MTGAFYGPLAMLYDDVVVDPCFGDWAQFLHHRWDADPEPVLHILDVGCGTGLLARELVDLGYDVVGLDGSPAMLEHARRQLGADALLVQAVLPEVPDVGQFDAAVSTFDTLNYLTPTDMATTMGAVAQRLRPGGWWIFDLHTDALLGLMAEQPHGAGEQAGWAFTLDSTVDADERTCRTQFRATHHATGRTVAEDHEQFFFSDEHVQDALRRSGFDAVEVVDEYSEVPRTESTLRATWIARRSAQPSA